MSSRPSWPIVTWSSDGAIGSGISQIVVTRPAAFSRLTGTPLATASKGSDTVRRRRNTALSPGVSLVGSQVPEPFGARFV